MGVILIRRGSQMGIKFLKLFFKKIFLQRHITADKRLRYAPLKLPLATSFIRKTLYAIGRLKKES